MHLLIFAKLRTTLVTSNTDIQSREEEITEQAHSIQERPDRRRFYVNVAGDHPTAEVACIWTIVNGLIDSADGYA